MKPKQRRRHTAIRIGLAGGLVALSCGALAQHQGDDLYALIDALQASDRMIVAVEASEDGTLRIDRRFPVTGSRIVRVRRLEISTDRLAELDHDVERVLEFYQPLTVYSRADLDRTGSVELADGLRLLDPRIRIEYR